MADESVILNDRYQLLNRIGAGGMSVVFRAQDLALGRLVAVKILHESLTGDPTFLERFRREAHAAASLSHPNVVTVHDVGQDEARHYIVMELVEGQDLKTIIRQKAPLPLEKALDMAIQICRGIGYAHRAGFVHCDVKPQNVLVTRDDRVLVADFGIARVISEATMSREDLAWGTPHYFSPEQAAGEMATPASDVYAIGVILFEMLSGKLPFEAESPTALALKHLRDEPPWLTDLNPEVPLPIAKIVAKVLAKEPAARYRMADQLGRILESYRAESAQATSAGTLLAISDEQLLELPVSAPQPAPVSEHEAEPEPGEEEELGVDWVSIFLGATALLAILGLIPLWISVYHAYVEPASQPGTYPIVLFAIRSIYSIIMK
jgi:serine/threonine-protein kinase